MDANALSICVQYCYYYNICRKRHTSLFSVQYARMTISCAECGKSRVLFMKNRLSSRQQVQMALLLSQVDYTCGAPLTTPGHALHGVVHIRININCGDLMEIPYYSSKLGQSDICCRRGSTGAVQETELLRKFETVLPLCNTCKGRGYKMVCQRPINSKK